MFFQKQGLKPRQDLPQFTCTPKNRFAQPLEKQEEKKNNLKTKQIVFILKTAFKKADKIVAICSSGRSIYPDSKDIFSSHLSLQSIIPVFLLPTFQSPPPKKKKKKQTK